MNIRELLATIITTLRWGRLSVISIVTLSLLTSCALQMGNNQSLQLIRGSAPLYPANLKSQGVGGSVTIAYDVTTTGEVVNARVVSSDPESLFDNAALIAVSSWKFQPQIREGRAEIVQGLISTLEFRAP